MRYSLLVILILSLISCKEVVYKEIFTSPDSKTKTIIEGKKQGMGAWKVEVTVKSPSFEEGPLFFEIFNEDLKDHVHFDWISSNQATLRFDQTDGVSRNFSLISSDQQLYLGEIK